MTQEPQKRTGRGRGRGIAIGFSLIAHVVALVLLAWTTPALRLPTTVFAPDVTVELVRRVPLQRSTPNPAAAPRAAEALPAAASTQAARHAPAPPPLPPLPAPNRPSPRPAPSPPPSPTPAPSPAPPGPPARPGPPSPAPAASDAGQGGDVRGAVRAAIGCNHEDFLKLKPAERAACERKMAEKPPSGAYVDPIPPLKRGAYDRRAVHDERCHRYATPVAKPGPTTGIDARPVFDSAPSAVAPSGPPPPGPWLFC